MCFGLPTTSACYPGFAQSRRELGTYIFDVAFAVAALLVQRSGDAVIGLGIQLAEGEVFQLPFQCPDAEPVREWRVEFARFPRDATASFRRESAGMTRTHELLRESRDHQSRITDNREQHLAQGLGLRRCERPLTRPAVVEIEVTEPEQRVAKPDGFGTGERAHRSRSMPASSSRSDRPQQAGTRGRAPHRK